VEHLPLCTNFRFGRFNLNPILAGALPLAPAATCFCCPAWTGARTPPLPPNPWPPQEFRSLLRQPACHALLTHKAAEQGPGALPVGQRSFVQEVTLRAEGPGQERARFLFVLNMHSDGCWLVRKFEAR
jgi:hypothetical protein